MSEQNTNVVNDATTTAEGGNTTPQQEGKTFTQDDVNRIVGERLGKEKAKADADLAKREQEIAQRELMLSAKEKITATGLPVDFVDALNISSPEALDKSLSILDKFIKNLKPETPALPVGVSFFKPDGSTGGDGKGDAIRKAMGLSK